MKFNMNENKENKNLISIINEPSSLQKKVEQVQRKQDEMNFFSARLICKQAKKETKRSEESKTNSIDKTLKSFFYIPLNTLFIDF